jgi:hypothetical protein
MDWTVNDVFEVVYHRVAVISFKSCHIKQAVEQVDSPLKSDWVQASFILEVVFVSL